MITNIDWPFRPKHGLWEKGTLIAGAVITVAAWLLWWIEPMPLIAAAIITVLMAGLAARDWHRIRDLEAARKRLSKTEKTGAELVAYAHEHPQSLYLGEGYPIRAPESQTMYAITEHGLDADLDTFDQENNAGAVWLRCLRPPQELAMPVKFSEGHVGIFGTTGAGKTRLLDLLIAQCAARKECVIIIDPKGDNELEQRARLAAKRVGTDYHYVHMAHPERSRRINPIANGASADELASRISSIMNDEKGANPFVAVSHMALVQIIGAYLELGVRPTLSTVYRTVQQGPAKLLVALIRAWAERVDPDWLHHLGTAVHSGRNRNADPRSPEFLADYYLNVLSKVRTNAVIDGLISQFRHDRSHFEKMVTSLHPVLSDVTSGELGPLFSPESTDTEDHRLTVDVGSVMNRGEMLYVGLSMLNKGKPGRTIGSILCADITSCAADRYNNTVQEERENMIPVNLFVDEASEIVNEPLIQALNKARGARFRIWLCAQTSSDYEARLGGKPRAMQAIGNMNNLIALRIQDSETQRLVLSKMGEVSITDVLESYGEGSAGLGGTRTNVSRRQSSRVLPLFPQGLFASLPTGDYVMKLQSGMIYKGQFPIITD